MQESAMTEAEHRGLAGEKYVNKMLAALPDSDYAVLENLLLPSGRNDYTQIDHSVFSCRGVFVIETKTFGGNIYCKASDRVWTQVMYGGEKFVFQNPLRQNYKHTQAIAKITGLPARAIHNVVVFAGDAKFKTEKPPEVLAPEDLADFIDAHEPVCSREEIMSAIRKVYQENRQNDPQARQRHLEIVQKKKELQEERRARHLARKSSRNQVVQRHSSGGVPWPRSDQDPEKISALMKMSIAFLLIVFVFFAINMPLGFILLIAWLAIAKKIAPKAKRRRVRNWRARHK